MENKNRQKVAIIGAGGAGLCTAWLLRHKYDVTLVESQDYLGGHAHTVYMEGDDGHSTCPIDSGFRLFHHEKNPTLGKYFNLLGVPTRRNRLVAGVKTYRNVDGEEKVVEEVVAPPMHSLGFFFKTLGHPWVFRAARIYFKALKHHKKRVNEGLTGELGVTVQDIMGKYSGSYKPLNRLMYPISTGAFIGSTYDDLPRYDFDNFVEFLHESKAVDPFRIDYSTVIGGVGVYAGLVENILKADHRVRIIKSCPVDRITKEINSTGFRQRVTSENGHLDETFDHVVMAVPPDVVLNIVPELSESVKEVLNMVELLDTRTIVHKDDRFSFPPDIYMNVHTFEDTRTNFIVGRPLYVQGKNDNIFTTTAKKEQISPESFKNVHHVFDRYGYALTPPTIHARNLLPEIQGQDNIWLCGAWGAGHYSHEGCIKTAADVAERLGMDDHPLK